MVQNTNLIYTFLILSMLIIYYNFESIVKIFLWIICFNIAVIIWIFSLLAFWYNPYGELKDPVIQAIPFIKWFLIFLLILWMNKYISSKIKDLFGFSIKNGVLYEIRTIPNPGVYNVFSDIVTSIGNTFIYIVTLEFMYPKKDDAQTSQTSA